MQGRTGRNASTRHNRLLSQLSSAEYSQLSDALELVELDFKEALCEQNRPILHVYFVIAGVVSVVTESHEDAVETATIGSEGVVGIAAFLGARLSPHRAFMQVAGRALRIGVEELRSAAERIPRLRALLLLYTHALMSVIAQTALCNRAHSVDQRMARWLLMTHDRVDGANFPMTQEFLSRMLGVHRPAVNLAGRKLQGAGIIRYSRGRMHILDRRGLEGASCSCYATVMELMLSARPPRRSR